MKISLDTILSKIGNMNVIIKEGMDQSRTFSDMTLFSKKEVSFRKDILYLTDCPMNMTDVDERVGLICVPDREDAIAAHNVIHDFFSELNAWEKKLERIILSGQTINDMLDVYTEMIPLHVIVWDASFNICGYTKSVAAPGEMVKRAEEKGFFPKELVEELVVKKMIAKSTDTESRILDASMIPSGNSAIIHHFFRQKIRYYSICIYLTDTNLYEKGMRELSEYFFEKFDLFLNYNLPKVKEKHYLYESFLVDLIENTLTDSNIIREKAETFHIEEEGTYYLYGIQLSDYKPTIARYIIETISYLMSDIKFVQYNNRIFLLLSDLGNRQTQETRQYNLGRLNRILTVHDAFCGISSTFHNIRELRSAYEQTEAAIRYGHMFESNQADRIYFYKNYYIYHFFEIVSGTMDLGTLYYKKMNMLMEEDLKKQTNNVELLDTYLMNNRKISQTAQILFMHRNSVIYRIKKIEEILDVDLENHDDFFRVDFSLHLLKYLFHTDERYAKYQELL